MSSNHHNLDFEVYVSLHDLKKILSKYNLDETYLEEMNYYLELIRTKRYRVAVIGEFSRGKSSLINALLGSAILPADILPATATINRVTFGLEPCVEIKYKDGSSENIAVDVMAEFVTKLTGESQEKASTIEEAIVYYPTVICQNHIDIIDTPGLNESEDMTFLTQSQMTKIDAAIVTISALSPLSETERLLIETLIESKEVGYIVFAVSFIDRLDEEDIPRMMEDITKRITMITEEIKGKYGEDSETTKKAVRILSNPEIYGVSAKKALKAFETNNNKLLKESLFPEFQKNLYRILTTQQNANAISKSLMMILSTREMVEVWHQNKSDELEAMIQKASKEYATIESFFGSSKYFVDQQIQNHVEKKNNGMFDKDLQERYQSACIEKLSNIKLDTDACIKDGLMQCNMRIRELTNHYLDGMIHKLRDDLKQVASVYSMKRKMELSDFVKNVSDEDAVLLENKMQILMEQMRELTLNKVEEFDFIMPETALIKHCNYIPFLQIQIAQYGDIVAECVNRTYEKSVQLLRELAEDDWNKREKILQMYQKYVDDLKTDKMLYEREYEKNKEELDEIYTYCENTIAEIL